MEVQLWSSHRWTSYVAILRSIFLNSDIIQASIRAYGVQETFKEESLHRIDRYTRAARTFYNLNRWICIRVDAIGGLFAAGLAAYLVYVQGHSAASTGFSLNMAGLDFSLHRSFEQDSCSFTSWVQ